MISIKSARRLSICADYISKDKGQIADHRPVSLFHNLLSLDLDEIGKEFEDNFLEFAKERQKVTGHHAILSLSPLDQEVATPEMLLELGQQFIDQAYPNALVFGAVHDAENPHLHLLISGNEVRSQVNTRISKFHLRDVHMALLQHMKDKYPELSSSINMTSYGQKLGKSEEEYYLQQRNPELSLSKDECTAKVQDIFRMSGSSQEFYTNLKEAGFETYEHQGKVFGVRFGEDDKKLRFSRMDIKPELIEELDRDNKKLNERLAELERLYEERENDKERENEETRELER